MVQPRACHPRTRSQKSPTAGFTFRTGSWLSGTTARIGTSDRSIRLASISDHTFQFMVGQMSSKRRRYFGLLGFICIARTLWSCAANEAGLFELDQKFGRGESNPAFNGHGLLAIEFPDNAS